MALLDLFKPRWRHSNAEIRLKAVREIKNHALLTKIGTEDEDPDVRKIAVQALWARRAIEAQKEAEAIDAALSAGERHAIEAEKEAKAIGAALRVTDETLLARIATEAKRDFVRESAVWRVADQALLARIAIGDESKYVRKSAAARLTEQAVLARIAKEDKDQYVREAARLRFVVITKSEQERWARIAIEGNEPKDRLAALERVTDKGLIASIVTEANDWAVRAILMKRAPSSLVRWIASEDKDERVRMAAIDCLERHVAADEELLARIITEDKDHRVREHVVWKLRDQSLLYRIAGKDPHPDVRLSAFHAMSDEGLKSCLRAEGLF